jgi:NAD(P)-dependent dehydrogenase (short-subunit alcohol dehydrogenase family)
VVLACRRPDAAAEAVQRIMLATGNAHVEALPLDLASLTSVRRFAASLGPERPPLKAIVCNAGVQVVSGTTFTEDGFETTFGVNHLGHFLLVNLLLFRLRGPARVVFVASGTHDPAQNTGMPAPVWMDPHELARPTPAPPGLTAEVGRSRYTTSKLCNVLCAYELARRLEDAGLTRVDRPLTVTAFDPGMMPGSGLARDYGPLQRFAWRFLLPAMRLFMPNVNTTESSGRNLARLVTDPALATVTGRYFEGMADIRSSEESYDVAKARALWEASVELVGLTAADSPLVQAVAEQA